MPIIKIKSWVINKDKLTKKARNSGIKWRDSQIKNSLTLNLLKK